MAVFNATVKTYTITWKNYNGNTLEIDLNVPYGSMPTYDGSTPTKYTEVYLRHDFVGWDPSISMVIGDRVYVAKFVTYYNYD